VSNKSTSHFPVVIVFFVSCPAYIAESVVSANTINVVNTSSVLRVWYIRQRHKTVDCHFRFCHTYSFVSIWAQCRCQKPHSMVAPHFAIFGNLVVWVVRDCFHCIIDCTLFLNGVLLNQKERMVRFWSVNISGRVF